MSRSEARVSTYRAARFGRQLASHMGRRNGGGWVDDTQRGHIELSDGRAEIVGTADELVLTVDGPTEVLEQMEGAVGQHLVRFGARDELVVRWVRDDGQPGSEQRSDEPTR